MLTLQGVRYRYLFYYRKNVKEFNLRQLPVILQRSETVLFVYVVFALPGAVVPREQLLMRGIGVLLAVGAVPAALRPDGSVHLAVRVGGGVARTAGRGQVGATLALHLPPPIKSTGIS